MFTAQELFDLAIRFEDNGERFYRKALAQVYDESVRELLQRLADDEVEHRSHFKQLKEALQDSTNPLEGAAGFMLQDIVGGRAFSLDEVDMAALRTEEQVIAMAIEFEEDVILFFEMLQNFLQDREALDGLEEILNEERQHKMLLLEALEQFVV